MIKIDANEISASVDKFDSKRFLQQLIDWQEEVKQDSIVYFVDEVFDMFVDCCEFARY